MLGFSPGQVTGQHSATTETTKQPSRSCRGTVSSPHRLRNFYPKVPRASWCVSDGEGATTGTRGVTNCNLDQRQGREWLRGALARVGVAAPWQVSPLGTDGETARGRN